MSSGYWGDLTPVILALAVYAAIFAVGLALTRKVTPKAVAGEIRRTGSRG